MSISSAINAAQSGLQISGLRADIVASNVANANNPGYVRRSVVIAENLLAGETAGVRSNGITRAENAVLAGQRQAAASDMAQAGVLASTWQTLSARLGDTAEGTGLFGAFSDFEAALSNAALSPESGTEAAALLDAARGILREFHDLSRMAEMLRGEADRSIADGVDVVNDALQRIETLNGKISAADRTSERAAALMDERERLIDTISEYLPVRQVPRESGTIDIVTREGVFLLAGTARQIDFTPSSAFGPDRSLAGGTLSGLSVDGIDITPGAASYGAVSSGLFGALATIRDEDIPAFSARLDTIAGDLVARLSDDAIDPTKAAGEPGLFIDPDTSGAPGLAGRIALNPAIDPDQGGEVWRLRDGLGAANAGPPGNATTLRAMLDAVQAVRPLNANGLQGSFSAADSVAQFASLTGQARVHHEAVLSSTTAQHALFSDALQEETGVDVDAQMQELLLIEQAYAANARVIEVASQMLNRLMEL